MLPLFSLVQASKISKKKNLKTKQKANQPKNLSLRAAFPTRAPAVGGRARTPLLAPGRGPRSGRRSAAAGDEPRQRPRLRRVLYRHLLAPPGPQSPERLRKMPGKREEGELLEVILRETH